MQLYKMNNVKLLNKTFKQRARNQMEVNEGRIGLFFKEIEAISNHTVFCISLRHVYINNRVLYITHLLVFVLYTVFYRA